MSPESEKGNWILNCSLSGTIHIWGNSYLRSRTLILFSAEASISQGNGALPAATCAQGQTSVVFVCLERTHWRIRVVLCFVSHCCGYCHHCCCHHCRLFTPFQENKAPLSTQYSSFPNHYTVFHSDQITWTSELGLDADKRPCCAKGQFENVRTWRPQNEYAWQMTMNTSLF